MPSVTPFRALRPRPDLASKIASPPYDVLSREEARRRAGDNPLSFLRVIRADLEFPDATDPHGAEVHTRSRENLDRLRAEGALVEDPEPGFSLYRMTREGNQQTGLVALLSLDDYEQGTIKKHEQTRPEKVRDRADHMEALEAQVGPVLSAFRSTEATRRALTELTSAAPQFDLTDEDGVRHQVWVVSDEAGRAGLSEAFAGLDAIYVADGHHRSEASAEVHRRRKDASPAVATVSRTSHFLGVLFPHDQLTILPYNRVVRGLSPDVLRRVLSGAESRFLVEKNVEAIEEPALHEFGLYLEGRWHRLAAKPGTFEEDHPTRSIDTAILAENFLAPILDIQDERNDERVSFVGGARGASGLRQLVDGGEAQMAIALHATTMDQLLAVADAGGTMPPKSTWFEPKLRSGLVSRLLSDGS